MGALVAAILIPHVRRQLRVPASVTVASTVAAPLAIAVLWPRSKKRDLGLFFGQMWAFAVSHELPYDNPDRLRERLRIEYPIKVDRWIGRGVLPNARLQRAVHAGPAGDAVTKVAAWVHWLWFIEPYGALFWILLRKNAMFPQSARQMAAVFDIGCALYFLVPTAPPWWASENGYTRQPVESRRQLEHESGIDVDETVHRVMVEFGEDLWGPSWTRVFGTLNGNPWAAMPSIHFATAVMAAILVSDAGGKIEGVVAWGYAVTLGFSLVYLGEHYVTDLIAGAGVVAIARNAEPLTRPLVRLINNRMRRLEAIAAS
ncbi:MAG: phosphatase PAP2 family protein [Thermoleophilia bacterium]|nr:phosphatase PAP2 family protein [Thermoleophilia bacterium]